jgi:hypothetical protein
MNLNLPIDAFVEASWMELTISENSKFYPFKLDLQNFGLVPIGYGFLVFGFLVRAKLGFDFSGCDH